MRRKHRRTKRFTLHGVLVVVAVVSILLIEEGCSNETDLAGPSPDPPRLAETPVMGDLSDEFRFDHPMYDLPSGPSVTSHIKRRIETLELDTCVVRGELPVDLGLDSVSGRLPGGDFGA